MVPWLRTLHRPLDPRVRICQVRDPASNRAVPCADSPSPSNHQMRYRFSRSSHVQMLTPDIVPIGPSVYVERSTRYRPSHAHAAVFSPVVSIASRAARNRIDPEVFQSPSSRFSSRSCGAGGGIIDRSVDGSRSRGMHPAANRIAPVRTEKMDPEFPTVNRFTPCPSARALAQARPSLHDPESRKGVRCSEEWRCSPPR